MWAFSYVSVNLGVFSSKVLLSKLIKSEGYCCCCKAKSVSRIKAKLICSFFFFLHQLLLHLLYLFAIQIAL